MRATDTPFGLKIGSLILGLLGTALLLACEIPLETVLAAALPVFGLVGDLAIDGLEFILVPLLIACSMLSLSVKAES